ncbi:MAG: pyridoxal phosphate-dependent aminotransferase [Candidatus Scatomorpha sp.]|jgi:aspartate aminotransferase
MKLSRKILECPSSPISKFDSKISEAVKKGKKIYRLNIGQPDIKTPKEFFEAVSNYEVDTLAYAPSPGISEYVESIQGYFTRMGIELKAEEIVATAGGSEALLIALFTILEEGSEVIIPEPFYPNYFTYTILSGAKIRGIKTSTENGYRYATKEQIEPLINENTRAIMISNPSNPTGIVLSDKEMELLKDIAREHRLFLISDEVYREFAYSDEPLKSMLSYSDIDENLIVIDSVSKRFSACGARVGCLISRNMDFMTQAMKIAQTRLSVASVDQIGSAALYRLDPEYFNEIKSEYMKRRDLAIRKLDEIPGIVFGKPDGAFYIMAKLPVDNSEKLMEFLLDKFEDNGETVIFSPGTGFYEDVSQGKDEIRIAYVLNGTDLARALELLKLGIEAYNSRK